MRQLLVACALFAVALGAGAQCVSQPLAKTPESRSFEFVRTTQAATAGGAPAARAGEPFVKVAARGTHGMDSAPVAIRAKADPATREEHPRRAGPAMLLAVLAVMSGIALRRLGASSR